MRRILVPAVAPALAALAVAALAVVAAPPAAAAAVPPDAKKLERTVPFKPEPQKLDLKVGDVTIESVEIKNWPDAGDFAKGEKDPSDTKTMWVVFTYSNRADKDYKCRYAVTVKDPKGSEIWAQDDSTRTLDARQTSDTNRFGVKMKTHRYKLAKTMTLTFEIWKK